MGNFHGMDMTRDKLCSLVRKWQTLIEATVDVKTTDGYLLRVFCMGFTKKLSKHIRKKMVDIMAKQVSGEDLKAVVLKLIPDSIGKDIEKECLDIYPLHDVHIRKVKVLKKPKFDLGRLMDLHGEIGGATDENGEIVATSNDFIEPQVQESV